MKSRWTAPPIEKLGNKEVAAIVAEAMFLLADASRVFRGSIRAAMGTVWPRDTFGDPLVKAVYRNLLRWGFTPIGNYGGWNVPDKLPAMNLEDPKWKKVDIGPEPPPAEVAEGFTCTVEGCGSFGERMTKQRRDVHYRRHHRGTKPSSQKGKPHPNYLSKQQRKLLSLVTRRPGLHPREYAELLHLTDPRERGNLTRVGSRMVRRGLLVAVSKTAGRRWYPPKVEVPDLLAPHPKPKPPAKTSPRTNGQDVKLIETSNGRFVVLQGKMYKLVEV